MVIGLAGLVAWRAMLPPLNQRSPEVRTVLHDDLCTNVFRDREFGYTAKVVFRFPLTPTADPLVYEYRPGIPAKAFAPTVRVVFKSIPPLMKSPTVVLGTVARIEPDDRPRKSRHLGVVVISGCRVAP